MAALMQTSSFLGQSLKRSTPIQPTQAPRVAPVQAFFKKAEKEVKKAAPKGNATQRVKSAAKSVQKKAGMSASKAEPKQAKQAKSGGLFSNVAQTAKKAAPKPPAKPVQKAKKAAPKPPAKPVQKAKQAAPKKPFAQAKKAATQVKRAAPSKPKPVRQVQSAANRAGKSSKGWLGGVSGPKGLDQWYGPSRALYLPRGLLDPQDIPSYLNGSLAGDYGYDPLGLGQDPAQVEKYRANELIHARWAMLAAAGIIIPEGLQANGADIKGGTWFETGAEMLGGGTLNYFAVPWGIVNNPLPLALIVVIEVALLGATENYRARQEGPPGYSPGVGKFDSNIFNGLDNLYPGGPFDPLGAELPFRMLTRLSGLADDPETFQELKVKEIKNGRLALVAVLGFAVQAAVTGEGPYANWSKHVSDPFGYNLLTILGSEDRLPTL